MTRTPLSDRIAARRSAQEKSSNPGCPTLTPAPTRLPEWRRRALEGLNGGKDMTGTVTA